MDELRLYVVSRITGIQTIDIGENDQQICIDLTCNKCTETIVVPYSCPNFCRADHIVLIEDGDDPEIEQTGDRILQIHEGASLVQLTPCNKHLSTDETMRLECSSVVAHQHRLPDCRTRLSECSLLHSTGSTQLLCTESNRSGRYE